jgi:hypothetical protein
MTKAVQSPSNVMLKNYISNANTTFETSFRNYQPKSAKLKEHDIFRLESSKRHRILEQISQKNGVLGVKNPLDYIWNNKKYPSLSKDIELRVTKNRFDFAHQQKSLNNYALVKKHYGDGPPKFQKNKFQPEFKFEDEKASLNFLSKLENTIKINRQRALEDDDVIKKRIV